MGFLNKLWNGAATAGSQLGQQFDAAMTPNATTAAASSLGAQTTGTALEAGGNLLEGLGALSTGLYQAKVGDRNAKMQEANAVAALDAGYDAEARSRIASGQLKGAQKAALAANGVDVASPVAQDLLRSSEIVGDMDAAVIHYNAQRESYASRIDALSSRTQAGISRTLGVNAFASSVFKAGESYISGSSSLGAKWANFRSVGAR